MWLDVSVRHLALVNYLFVTYLWCFSIVCHFMEICKAKRCFLYFF